MHQLTLYHSIRAVFDKFWWDEELSLLKENSINARRLWTAVGKPRSGEIFRNKQQAKYEYKSAIRTKETASRERFTNELNDALAKKDSSSFWKTWQSIFSRKRVSPVIDGTCDPAVIAEKFANVFKTACAPNSTERHESSRDEFNHRFPRYDWTVVLLMVFKALNWLSSAFAS